MTVRADAVDPAIDLVPINPSDTIDLSNPARALRCRPDGSAGTVRVTTVAGQTRDTAIALGEVLAIQVSRVHSTGTTATGLEALI